MATLVFSALGTALGGPLGGSLGALLGRQVDGAIFGRGKVEGPRLKELSATTSSYGVPVPRLFGRMRVAGSIIWSTDLVEHRGTRSAKNRPATTTYSYTVSFAVALSSRPIRRIGRIWADGNLLRGAAGDLKAAGTLRVHTGDHDQPADPFIAAAEGSDRCPAHRGLAYVVFEDLDLSDFYNRVPSLTFEVFADEDAFSLQDIVAPMLDEAGADVALPGMRGLVCEGSLLETLQTIHPFYPIACDAGGSRLTFAADHRQQVAFPLGEAAVSVRDGDFGGPSGFVRRRLPVAVDAPQVLRYYDVDRDYQPGTQRAGGRASAEQPRTIELPAAMTCGDAQDLVSRVAARSDWARETIQWRTAELDEAVAPRAIITIPGQLGHWRIEDWEWRETGVELTLKRMVPGSAGQPTTLATDAGRVNAPLDAPATPTLLTAFELPWDGTGSADAANVMVAASSASASWKGAALFADRHDGNLVPIGSTGRVRSIMGVTEAALAAAHPLLLDRVSALLVRLPDRQMTLVNADLRQLAEGANRALVGNEVIQFARSEPLGGGRWRPTQLLRGRGGTELAVTGHVSGETFVLLDDASIALDDALVGADPVSIVAEGLADADPVSTTVNGRGRTRRPLMPVHGRMTGRADGGLTLGWTRRSRGAWTWRDLVDVPLREQTELYRVTLGDPSSPVASWDTTTPELALDPATVSSLRSSLPQSTPSHRVLMVRQRGDYAWSDPLMLGCL